MAIAEILSRVTAPAPKASVTGASRDDRAIGGTVVVESVNTGLQYAWSIAFKPEGSTAVFSSTGTEQAVIQNPGTFTVDKDGPYLIRLMITDATGTAEQFVRLRALTAFADLKLVAAGERYDTLRVPVDATSDGWADEQNFNLNTLLGLAKSVTSTGRVVYVDQGAGDYNTIQEAIDYAVSQVPSSSAQWVVLVRPGIYQEDLTFAPHVHVLGWPGAIRNDVVKVRCASNTGHAVNLPGATDSLVVANLTLQQPTLATAGLTMGGVGSLTLHEVGLTGMVFIGGTTTLTAIECQLDGNGAAATDFAVDISASATFNALRTVITGQSGIIANDQSRLDVDDCQIQVTGTYGISTRAEEAFVLLTSVEGGGVIAANPTGAGAAGNMELRILYSAVGDVSIDGQNVVGAATLRMGSVHHGTITAINGATYTATTPSDTVYYDNALAGHPTPLVASNVQNAIDEVYDYASKVRTLDDAYDGGITGSGSGRSIIADQGAVQILDSSPPSPSTPVGNTNGNLEVLGSVSLGAISKPELTLDPNPFGNGPTILMGKEIWANDAPFGSTALLLGDASGNPTYHNYNLRVGTKPADGGNQVGSLYLRAGDSLTTINAGSVFVQGGAATDAGGGAGGDVYLVPGQTAGGADGKVYVVDPSTATAATLTAAGVFAGAAVAGDINIGTEFGSVTVTFAGGENLAAVHALFNATGVITAAGDPIVLSTVSKGQTSEVFHISSDAGVDAALGAFSGQAMVPGTWPTTTVIGGPAGGGDVTGPALSTDNALVRFDGVTGKIIQNSDAILTDGPNGELILAGDLAVSPNAAGFDAFARLDRLDATSDAAIVYQTGAASQWVVGIRSGATGYTISSGGGADERLKVDSTGVVRVNDAFSFPTTDGAANQFLQTDGAGNVTWATAGAGDVTGPGASTNNALVRFDGVTGKVIQNSNAILDNTGNLNLEGSLTVDPPGAGVDAFGLFDRFDNTSSSSIIHTTGAAPDWITGTTVGNSNYTIADGGGTERFRVTPTGDVRINNAFTLPSTDGIANQFLQTDGAGNVSWAAGGGGGWPTSTGQMPVGVDYEMAELTSANAYIVLKPGPNGAIQTDLSDSAGGGDFRGLGATDWQRIRTAPAQVASGTYSVIAGGRQNEASGLDSTVSGGQANQANGDQSTIGGGQLNDADAIHSAIGGGLTNEVGPAGTFATIPGGRENALVGQGTLAMGVRARTFRTGQMVHASGSFTGAAPFGDAQHGRMVLRTTTNNGQVELNSNLGLGGGTTANDFLTLDNQSGIFFTLHVVARAVGSPSPQEDAWWSVEGCIVKENSNLNTFMIGPPLPTAPDGTRGVNSPNWQLLVGADTANGKLRIVGNTTGYAGDVRWVATLQTTQVGV